MDTENCVMCGRHAITWTGYVVFGNRKVFAGWCKEHVEIAEIGYGSVGKWTRKMGLRSHNKPLSKRKVKEKIDQAFSKKQVKK